MIKFLLYCFAPRRYRDPVGRRSWLSFGSLHFGWKLGTRLDRIQWNDKLWYKSDNNWHRRLP